MVKKLVIKNDTDLRLKMDFRLNKLILTLEKKLTSMEIIPIFIRTFEIDKESKIDEILENFYEEYLKLKEIEEFWSNEFAEAKVIEFGETD